MLKLKRTAFLLFSHSTKTYVLNIIRINNVFSLSYSGPIQALPIQDKHLKPLFISDQISQAYVTAIRLLSALLSDSV